MKKRTICLSVFGVIFAALIFLMMELSSIVEAQENSKLISVDGIDPTDMSAYYAMGEYYPPDKVDTLNVNWVGGRVEIIAYNESSYFVEESATRQLMENERLSYTYEGKTFSIFYLGNDETIIDNAFKKVEIRIPKQLADKMKSINVNTNGEVVLKNIKADNITVNNIDSTVLLDNTYSKNTRVETKDGTVKLRVENDIGYTVDFKSWSGKLDSYIENGKNKYRCGMGTYPFTVKTKSGNFIVELITPN